MERKVLDTEEIQDFYPEFYTKFFEVENKKAEYKLYIDFLDFVIENRSKILEKFPKPTVWKPKDGTDALYRAFVNFGIENLTEISKKYKKKDDFFKELYNRFTSIFGYKNNLNKTFLKKVSSKLLKYRDYDEFELMSLKNEKILDESGYNDYIYEDSIRLDKIGKEFVKEFMDTIKDDKTFATKYKVTLEILAIFSLNDEYKDAKSGKILKDYGIVQDQKKLNFLNNYLDFVTNNNKLVLEEHSYLKDDKTKFYDKLASLYGLANKKFKKYFNLNKKEIYDLTEIRINTKQSNDEILKDVF